MYGISFSLNVLGWYTPGISELPLGHRLFRLLAGESLFSLCACVYPEHGSAGEPGGAACDSRRLGVEGGLKGARSPFFG